MPGSTSTLWWQRLSKTSLRSATIKATDKSRKSTTDSALLKLTEVVDGKRRFRSDPPLLTPVPEGEFDDVVNRFGPVYEEYLRTLQADRIALLAKYSFVDIAHKVVGVGSVGTRAIVLLLESGDGEPLLLQVKQANPSVLEPYLGASQFDNAGKRVVVGQRVMQAAGDPFLGWTRGSQKMPHDFYVRQLKDMKGSIDVTLLDKEGLTGYGQVCGAVLARAHARAGDASLITGYLGDSDEFDNAVAEFAMAYAQDQRGGSQRAGRQHHGDVTACLPSQATSCHRSPGLPAELGAAASPSGTAALRGSDIGHGEIAGRVADGAGGLCDVQSARCRRSPRAVERFRRDRTLWSREAVIEAVTVRPCRLPAADAGGRTQ